MLCPRSPILVVTLILTAARVLAESLVPPVPHYQLSTSFFVPGDGGWDYVSVDGATRRLYVSHGDQIQVLDSDNGKQVGVIANARGAHGVAFAQDLNLGFTSNGDAASVTVFDLQSLTPVKDIPVSEPDFILYDPFTHRIFPFNETTTVIDAKSLQTVGQLKLGGSPEGAVSDGDGRVFINLEDKAAIAVIDPATLQVETTYPLGKCRSPHSLLYDSSHRRLFVGCENEFAVVDASSGKVVATTLLCAGGDSGAFDAAHALIFLSCAEGVVSVIRQLSADQYQLADTIKTQVWARTMAFDPATMRMFLPVSDFEIVRGQAGSDGLFRSQRVPASFKILVLSRR